jgi:hypothetical protein
MVCENRVQMQWHSGMLVFFKRWKDFAIKVKMEVSDILVFKYKNIVFLMQMYRAVWDCAEHSAVVTVVNMTIG